MTRSLKSSSTSVRPPSTTPAKVPPLPRSSTAGAVSVTAPSDRLPLDVRRLPAIDVVLGPLLVDSPRTNVETSPTSSPNETVPVLRNVVSPPTVVAAPRNATE